MSGWLWPRDSLLPALIKQIPQDQKKRRSRLEVIITAEWTTCPDLRSYSCQFWPPASSQSMDVKPGGFRTIGQSWNHSLGEILELLVQLQSLNFYKSYVPVSWLHRIQWMTVRTLPFKCHFSYLDPLRSFSSVLLKKTPKLNSSCNI